MNNKTKIYYWCPFISKVATIKAVYNSAVSVNKFSKNNYEGVIIDTFGEWKDSNYFQIKNSVFTELKVSSIIKKIPSFGFFFSRLKFILIFLLSYFPLKNFLKKKRPKFLIIHLMTSLPLFLNLINNFETKIILRISGKPKLNFIRYFFWKIALKKVFRITFPTKETLEYFKKINLVANDKLYLMYDPIISAEEIDFIKKKEEINDLNFGNKEYFLAIGRLTKQKNFSFLIECFNDLIKKDNKINLLIIGEGEELFSLKNIIKKYDIQKNILLIGFKENVFKYLYKCKAFILASLWEDPGFVLLEAMYCNTIVLSSDCHSGPKEILDKKRGLLFKSNSKEDFIKNFNTFNKLDKEEKYKIKYNAKKFTKNFSLLNHYKKLETLLS
jgi:glycosyltransferase involved in cell wall biosynthesis